MHTNTAGFKRGIAKVHKRRPGKTNSRVQNELYMFTRKNWELARYMLHFCTCRCGIV